jgi:hypothetical protein
MIDRRRLPLRSASFLPLGVGALRMSATAFRAHCSALLLWRVERKRRSGNSRLLGLRRQSEMLAGPDLAVASIAWPFNSDPTPARKAYIMPA